MVFNFDAVSFILGLGYVMGLRIALIFCAGGVLVNFVLVPMIWFVGSHMGDVTVYPATIPISHMTAADIYRNYVRFIGVGAIASAGLVGILKSLRVIARIVRHRRCTPSATAKRPRWNAPTATFPSSPSCSELCWARSQWPPSLDSFMFPGPSLE